MLFSGLAGAGLLGRRWDDDESKGETSEQG